MATQRRNTASPARRTPEQNKRLTIFIICAVLAVALVIGLTVGLVALFAEPKDDGLILPNVTVGGVNIGGMTPAEAESALELSVAEPLTRKDLTLELPGASLVLAPGDTKVQLDVQALVQAAYRYGRSGSAVENRLIRARAETTAYIVPLLPYLELDTDYIRGAVEAFCDSYSIEISNPTVVVEGQRPQYVKPEYDEDGNPVGEDPNLSATHQVMTIVTGTPQFLLESEDLMGAILDAYSLLRLTVNYEAPKRIEPEKVDLAALFKEYCILPEDAEMDEKTFEITPEVIGYGFRIEDVQKALDEAGYGKEVKITLGFLMPDITEKAFGELFQDVLATFTATAKDEKPNANRDNNLMVSCEAINGYVLKPGESFDFNKILGPRTSEKGYLSAPDYTGSAVSSIGGGIAQTASALHYCAILAGLPVNERHTNSYAVFYTPLGTDAAINYGKQNLVFTNTFDEPIRILAEADGDKVTIRLMGTETREYVPTIESDIIKTFEPDTIHQSMSKDNAYGYENGQVIQAAHTGYRIEVYYARYDEETQELIGRDLLYQVSYAKVDQVVVRIEGADDPDPSDPTKPSEPDTTDPSKKP